jgi:ABC-type transporter Mla subunit MlaD
MCFNYKIVRMSSTKKDNIKENINQFKESTNKYLDEQNQQIRNTASNVSKTSENINESVNKFQVENKRVLENNVDTFRKYQEQINKSTQEITQNSIELQKNVFDTDQSFYTQFFDNIKNSNWKNFNIPQRYSETSDTVNKNIQNCTVNATNFVNEIAVGGIENFNKSIELTQRYYNDIVQNNFNYAQKIERSYNRQ